MVMQQTIYFASSFFMIFFHPLFSLQERECLLQQIWSRLCSHHPSELMVIREQI